MMNKRYKISFKLILLAVVLTAFAPFSVSAKGNKPHLISLSVKQADISELFEMLSRQNNINILLASGVEGQVSINLYNISVKDAIYSIASAADLAVERLGKGYLISKHSNVGKFIAGGLTDVRTYKIQYSDSTKISEILKKHLSQYGKIDILDERKMLVIEDKPEFLNRIEQLLSRLDHAPAQILIQAKILSIDLNNDQKYGIDWTRTFSAGGGSGNAGVNNGLADTAANLIIGSAGGPPGLFFNYLNKSIDAQLNLLSSKDRIRTLSTPSLLALEHQEAEVIIGDRKGYSVTTTINNVSTQSIQFLESGVILRVTPYIDRFNRIMMEIHPEVSIGNVNEETGIPDQITTEVTTRLLVEDGQTIFIGGLISNNLTNNHQGIPVLEDIPLLGYLFAKEDLSAKNKETIVMIKPQIIRPENTHLITSPQYKIDQFRDRVKQGAQETNTFFNEKYFHEND